MALDIVNFASMDDPSDLVVIAKQKPGSELHRVLQSLKSRDYTVLLVEPPADTTADSVFHSVASIVDCTQLLGGGKTITGRPPWYDSDDSDEEEDDDSCSYCSY